MATWREAFTSLNANSVTGTVEGTPLDLRGMIDRHAMHVSVSASGSPTYKIQLQGEWREGHGFVVLAELDEVSAPAGSFVLATAEGKPSRTIRAVCLVSSGTVGNVLVSVSSEE